MHNSYSAHTFLFPFGVSAVPRDCPFNFCSWLYAGTPTSTSESTCRTRRQYNHERLHKIWSLASYPGSSPCRKTGPFFYLGRSLGTRLYQIVKSINPVKCDVYFLYSSIINVQQYAWTQWNVFVAAIWRLWLTFSRYNVQWRVDVELKQTTQ